MENLPESLRDRRYYRPTDRGYERDVAQRLEEWWGMRRGGDKKEGGE